MLNTAPILSEGSQLDFLRRSSGAHLSRQPKIVGKSKTTLISLRNLSLVDSSDGAIRTTKHHLLRLGRGECA